MPVAPNRYYKRPWHLCASYARSKGWFSLFMGAFSYTIAISLSHCQDDFYDGMLHWFSFLHEQEYSQIWLSGIRSSMATTFNLYVAQARVFVQLLEPHWEQDSIDWLCKFNIPVWYPWGTQEVRASEGDPRLTQFAPPLHHLQESDTFLTKNPHPQPQPTTETQTRPYDCKLLFNSSPLSLNLYIFIYLGTASYTLLPSWKAFFEKCQAQNERLKAHKMPSQRQARENHERNPPTVRTKVFMWKRTESGKYCWESFYQAENQTFLSNYGKNQKVYDFFSNKWDCCSKFEISKPQNSCTNSIDSSPLFFFPPSHIPSVKANVALFQQLSDSRGMILSFLHHLWLHLHMSFYSLLTAQIPYKIQVGILQVETKCLLQTQNFFIRCVWLAMEKRSGTFLTSKK